MRIRANWLSIHTSCCTLRKFMVLDRCNCTSWQSMSGWLTVLALCRLPSEFVHMEATNWGHLKPFLLRVYFFKRYARNGCRCLWLIVFHRGKLAYLNLIGLDCKWSSSGVLLCLWIWVLKWPVLLFLAWSATSSTCLVDHLCLYIDNVASFFCRARS